jgi:hypothetical protein
MPPDTPATRFVVRRLRWYPGYGGGLTRLPGDTAVASFATNDEAVIDARRREEEARKQVNPFACGSALHYLTHLDEPRLRDWLMDAGIEPPEPKKDGKTNWAEWWKKQHRKLSAEQRAAVWEALDMVRFFTVAAEPARPVGYAVVQIGWSYNDEYYDADPEGGKLLKVFRSRQHAEEECERQNVRERASWGDIVGEFGTNVEESDYGMFDMRDRIAFREGVLDAKQSRYGRSVFPHAAGVPFFEVVEVELEGLQ